jgi:DNA-binding response OmpR family regulator
VTEASRLVLLAEDEPAIADLERLYLERDGFSVVVVRDGRQVLDAVAEHHPAVVLLDVGLPGTDGIEIVRAMRAAGDDTPVLLVTARDDEIDRVLGLELGADDYVTKPFSPRELVARVKAVLRRAAPAVRAEPAAAAPLRLGEVLLDPVARSVAVRGVDVAFTGTEFALLEHLMRHPGKVFSREELLREVWAYGTVVETRTVDVHVAQVRAKLGDALTIRTVRGYGYGAQR